MFGDRPMVSEGKSLPRKGPSVFKGSSGRSGGSGNKKWGYIGLIAMVLALVVGFIATSSEPPKIPDTTTPTGSGERVTFPTFPDFNEERTTENKPVAIPKKTMMFYFDGADLEEDCANATRAIAEILSSGVDTNTHNLIIYTCGSNKWHNYNIPTDKDCIYQIKNNGLQLLQQYPAKKVGESATLGQFMKYCVDNFPADQYGLLLQDHGGGPNHGVCSDFRNNHDTLLMDELQSAFRMAGFGRNNKLEYILFDACLMASLEVAKCMSDYASFMVASENVSYVYGSDYAFMKTLNTATSGEEICKAYVDCFYKESTELAKTIINYGESVYDITYSCVDLSKINALENAINNYFRKIGTNNTNETLYVRRCAENARGVMEFADSYGSAVDAVYDLVDFKDLVTKMGRSGAENEYDALMDALDDFIIYNKSTTPRMAGITVYSPEHINNVRYTYGNFGFASEYTKYVEACFKGAAEYSSHFVWNSLDTFNSVETSTSELSAFTVRLNDTQQDYFASAEYFILSKNAIGNNSLSEDEFIVVSGGNDVSVDNSGKLTAFYDEGIAVADNGRSESPVAATLYRNKTSDGDIVYTMYGELTDNAPSVQGSDFTLYAPEKNTKGKTKLTLSASGDTLTVTGASRITSADGVTASLELLDLDDYKGITLTNYVKEASYNVEGKLLPVDMWDKKTSAVTSSFALNDFVIEIEEPENSSDYYAVLIITDIYGNRHMTDITKINMD